jgi:hypothetical protein
MQERIFAGCFSTGIGYADRKVEVHGDYKHLAFLAFSTLELSFEKNCPLSFRAEIVADAAFIQAKRGEEFRVSTCGQTVLLGSAGFFVAIAQSTPTLADGREPWQEEEIFCDVCDLWYGKQYPCPLH